MGWKILWNKTILDMVEKYIGKSTRDYLEQNEGAMKKVIIISLIVIVAIIWLSFNREHTKQVAKIKGNNSSIVQNSPNTTIYNVTERRENPRTTAQRIPSTTKPRKKQTILHDKNEKPAKLLIHKLKAARQEPNKAAKIDVNEPNNGRK